MFPTPLKIIQENLIVIVWSSMLQCRYWHFAPLNTDPIIDQKCRRVNSAVRTFVIENGGGLFGMTAT
jgi:hypothetical protein